MLIVLFETSGRPLYIMHNCTSEIKTAVYHEQNKSWLDRDPTKDLVLYFFKYFNRFKSRWLHPNQD